MINETIDLYEYFSVPRGKNTGGILTVYARSKNTEINEKLRPAALIIPGGGYEFVSEREGEPVALRFLGEGYSAFKLTYTINAAYPVPLVEAAMAMAFIRQNAEKYSVDGDHVCAVGFSAGGHLTGMLATLYAAPEIPEGIREYVRPDAVILSYAVLTTDPICTSHGGTSRVISGGDDELRARLSLEKRVTSESSPAFLWLTANDDCVPAESSFRYAHACAENGVPYELHIFENGVHGLSMSDIETANSKETAQFNPSVAAWFPLALTWLKNRGFEVR